MFARPKVRVRLRRRKRFRKMDKSSRITDHGSRATPWRCQRCGICCKFIFIPIMTPVDLETESYLMAHGIAYDGNKLIVPAVCEYLDVVNGTPVIYKCKIHSNKFACCRLGGEEECKAAKEAWEVLEDLGVQRETKKA